MSDTKLVDEALVNCPICGVEGPRCKLKEHLVADHDLFAKERGGMFTLGVAVRFRPRLEQLREETGAAISRLVAIALDDYYGCHVSDAQESRV